MRFTILASMAMASVAIGQSLSDFPSCSLPCLEDAVKQTNCALTDVSCICGKFEVIQGTATGCIIKACGTDTALNKVLPATKKLCDGAGSGSSSSGGGSDASPSKQAAPTGSVTVLPAVAATGAPSPVPTAGAATVSSLGGVVMFALAALAL